MHCLLVLVHEMWYTRWQAHQDGQLVVYIYGVAMVWYGDETSQGSMCSKLFMLCLENRTACKLEPCEIWNDD